MDRNYKIDRLGRTTKKSHSVWSAWLEIGIQTIIKLYVKVALRLECVDRNTNQLISLIGAAVALRLECVDRNGAGTVLNVPDHKVALRLECVDRNTRRYSSFIYATVALRLECVDRNKAL